MPKKQRSAGITANVEFTEQEVIELQEQPASFTAKRKQKQTIDAVTTAIGKLKDMFISYQRGLHNSEKTIKFYEDCFKTIGRFVAFEYSDTVADFKKALEKYKDTATAGWTLPISFLQDDEFEDKYHNYLLNYGSQKIGKDGVSEQTMLKEFRGWRAIAYYAMENGWIEKRTIKIKNIEPDIKETYTNEELKKLLVAPDKDNYVEYRTWVMIQYMLATGNRIGSIVNLKVKDIDFEDGMIAVNEQKNNKPARIPLTRDIQIILKDYLRDYYTNEDGNYMRDDYLFSTAAGTKMAVSTAIETIADYNKAHKVSKTSCHLFRHTFAKRWITSGGGVLELQKMLNHKTLEMVKRYSNLYATDIKVAAENHALIGMVQTTQPNTKKKVRRK